MTWIADVRAAAPHITTVAAHLGLSGSRRITPCPACGADDRRHGPITPRHQTGWMCARCKEVGDGLRLISWSLLGQRAPLAPSQWAVVRACCAAAGWCAADDAVEWTPRPPPPPMPDAPYPDRDEVLHMLRTTTHLHARHEARIWAEARGWRAETITAARVLAPMHWPHWWPWGSAPWAVVVPAVDGDGVVRSLHARSIVADTCPKTRWPRDRRATGLLFADPDRARPMLRGDAVTVRGIVIAEGITDYIAACTAAQGLEGIGVLGATSGGFAALADALPLGVPCWIATDADGAGERYATELRQRGPHADLRRVILPPGADLDDALRTTTLPDLLHV